MAEILRKLRAEHDNLEKVLDVLEQEIESGRKGARLNRDIIRDVADYCQSFPALCHHPKEDLIYRRLRSVAEPPEIDAVGDVLAGHEALSALTDAFEAAVDNLLSDPGANRGKFLRAAQTFLEQYRQHMNAEDDVLFPLAEECLSDQDWAEIDRRVADLGRSHPSGAIDQRFAFLSQAIAAHEALKTRLARRTVW